MEDYRICHNAAPHRKDWWTVSKKRRGFLGRVIWSTVKNYRATPHGFHSWPKLFETEAEAEAWVAEDKRPRTHTCRPA